MHLARPTRPSAWRWLIACLCLAAAAVHAQVPRTMAYQGFLTTSAGQPVSASLSMTFSLYDQSSGGAALWAETRTVQVSNGAYTVLLGEVTPLALAFDKPYWLGVAVGADPEMTPRQALASAPYALKAGCNPGDRITCYTAGGDPGAGCATGVRVCNAQGTGFGPCAGEVTPNCNGNCVDFASDVNHCGACNAACAPLPNAAIACFGGACFLGACNSGFGNCNNNQADGCEIDTTGDVNHCGACNNACVPTANAAASACMASACIVAACNPGFANCDGQYLNGCEVHTLTNSSHCGGCFNACPNGFACSNGVCI